MQHKPASSCPRSHVFSSHVAYFHWRMAAVTKNGPFVRYFGNCGKLAVSHAAYSVCAMAPALQPCVLYHTTTPTPVCLMWEQAPRRSACRWHPRCPQHPWDQLRAASQVVEHGPPGRPPRTPAIPGRPATRQGCRRAPCPARVQEKCELVEGRACVCGGGESSGRAGGWAVPGVELRRTLPGELARGWRFEVSQPTQDQPEPWLLHF